MKAPRRRRTQPATYAAEYAALKKLMYLPAACHTLNAEDISRIRATRAEMARFDFLDQIPELIQTLDRILAANGAKP